MSRARPHQIQHLLIFTLLSAPATIAALRSSSLTSAKFNQILTGAETLLAGASNDSDTELGFTVEPDEEVMQVPVEGEGDGVHCFLALEGDEEDVRGGEGDGEAA